MKLKLSTLAFLKWKSFVGIPPFEVETRAWTLMLFHTIQKTIENLIFNASFCIISIKGHSITNASSFCPDKTFVQAILSKTK